MTYELAKYDLVNAVDASADTSVFRVTLGEPGLATEKRLAIDTNASVSVALIGVRDSEDAVDGFEAAALDAAMALSLTARETA